MNWEQIDIIPTSSVKMFFSAIGLLTNMPGSTIFTVTGRPGLGKTMAVNYYIQRQKPQTHTGMSPCLKVVVPPRPTPLSLTALMLEELGENPRGRNAQELAIRVIRTLERYDIKLLIFDECDRLNDVSFDTLRNVHDNTQIPIALVGLPNIMHIIKRYEQFDSRVAMEVKFEPLELEELIDSFLPNLKLSRWAFDPASPDDRKLAEFVWSRVKPSLRRLSSWIQIANKMAEAGGISKVNLEIVKSAANYVRLDSNTNEEETDTHAQSGGKYEKASEKRKKAKK